MFSSSSSQVSGYNISSSLRFRSSASAYLSRTFGGSGSRTTWTFSTWVKRGQVGILYPTTGYAQTLLGVNDSDKIWLYEDLLKIYLGTGATYGISSADVFRDPAAWYHIVVVLDTTNATSADRVRFYVNNRRLTVSGTMPTQNWASSNLNSAINHNIGKADNSNYYYYDGYMTEINFVGGQALTPASFGETDTVTGVWKPKKYAGTYGTNGFYLNFSDNSNNTAATIGKDSSGNGNNWTPNNISVTTGVTYDSMIDTPTPYADGGTGRGNYCVLNKLSTTAGTHSNANLRYTGPSSWRRSNSTFSVTSGKWYWEVTLANAPYGNVTNGAYNCLGFGLASVFDSSTGASTVTDAVILADCGYYKNFSGAWTNGGVAFSSGDVLAVAVDLGANTFTFYRNNSQVVTGTIGVTAGTELTPCILSYDGSYGVMDCNFGQRPFTYTPPTGFKALNTQNLPNPAIKKGNAYFDATTYTGNGTSVTVTNSGSMQPDLVWLKSRSSADQHNWIDAVRTSSYRLRSDATSAEEATPGTFTFNSNGFTSTTSNVSFNGNTYTYVGWQWKKGATPGFDIVTYTGDGTSSASRTIAHSLGVNPSFIITKKRSSGTTDYGWSCWHKDLGGNYGIWLHSTSAKNPSMWAGYSSISSTVFTPPDLSYGNENGQTYVNYLFAEVAGFSKFGSYTGNGSADGPFVYCGFRPRFVMFKLSSGAGQHWQIMDTARPEYNPESLELFANLSNAEQNAVSNNRPIDILANGFKIRGTDANANTSSATYIYVAFAENPFKYALAR